MSSGKLTKEQLRTPDFFVSQGQQMAEFIVRYQAVFLIVGALALLGGVSWLGISFWQSHRENAAATALYPVEKKIQTDVEKTKTISDATISEYQKVLSENASARSSLVSLITLAPQFVKSGKATWALDALEKLRFHPSSSTVHFGLERMTQGLLAMESQQFDKAIGFYQDILNQPAQKSFQADALLKLGVAYQMKNDFAKAQETFEKVRREHPRTQAGELAFEYLLYLAQQKGA